ncbi:MAG: class IV adenylate cyclase [Promethearchaeota archaeon]
MFEVEIKVKLENPEEFITSLSEYNLKYEADLVHIDTYYNMPKELRNFEKTDEALRVRQNICYKPNHMNDDNAIVSKSADITYKGPKLDKTTKSRLEIVCKIEDPHNLDKILKILGFRKILNVKKQRKLFKIKYENENIEIVIDKVQYLEGTYCELEIQVPHENEIEKKRQLMFNFLNKLGISKKKSIKTSYLELVLQNINKI